MTKRVQFQKAIRTLEKLKNGQLIDTEDMKIDEIINLLKESCPKPYESRKKENCSCGAASRQIKVWYGGGTYACKCDVCDKTGPWCKTEIEAIRSWNDSSHFKHTS